MRFQKILGLVALTLIVIGGLVGSFRAGSSEESAYEKYGNGVEGAMQFVRDVDRLMDNMPEKYKKMEVTQETITLWEVELLPYFEYEQVVNTVEIPAFIETNPEFDAMGHFHILGFAQCDPILKEFNQPLFVHMNLRTLNPVSPWYGDPERFLPTLIHEFAHIQGVCGNGWVDENAAQLVTAEVGSAVVNSGNMLALYPMLSEFRSIALAYLHYEALKASAEGDEDAEAEYLEFRNEIITDPFERQRWDKSQRHWNKNYVNKNTYRGILHDYNWTVWKGLMTALRTGESPDTYLPFYADNPGDQRNILRASNYDGQRKLLMDDFVAFVENMEALAGDVR